MDNPKQFRSNLVDCIPQKGPCPIDCPECYYNLNFYAGHEPIVPKPEDVKDKIVRVNSGNDSNVDVELVIKAALKYENFFFNTSIDRLNFPGPVVFTANADETRDAIVVANRPNLMFVRLKTSPANLNKVQRAVEFYISRTVPVVITFMRYFEKRRAEEVFDDANYHIIPPSFEDVFEHKTHIKNSWWQLTEEAKVKIASYLGVYENILINTCGSIKSPFCKDCRNCEAFYWISKNRIEGTSLLSKYW